MHDSRLESDGISQRPDIQQHLNTIVNLKLLRTIKGIIAYQDDIDYAIDFLENSIDDLR